MTAGRFVFTSDIVQWLALISGLVLQPFSIPKVVAIYFVYKGPLFFELTNLNFSGIEGLGVLFAQTNNQYLELSINNNSVIIRAQK